MVQLNFEGLQGSYEKVNQLLEITATTDFKEYLNEYGQGTGYELFEAYRQADDGYDLDVSYMAMKSFSVVMDWELSTQAYSLKKYQLCDQKGRTYKGDTLIGPASFLAPLFYQNVSAFLTNYPEQVGNRYNNKKLPAILADLASPDSCLLSDPALKDRIDQLLHLIHGLGNVVLYPFSQEIDQGKSLNQLKGFSHNDSGFYYLEKVRALLTKSRPSDGSLLEERILRHYAGVSWENYVAQNFLLPFIKETGEVKPMLNLDNPTFATITSVNEAIIARGNLILAAYQKKEQSLI